MQLMPNKPPHADVKVVTRVVQRALSRPLRRRQEAWRGRQSAAVSAPRQQPAGPAREPTPRGEAHARRPRGLSDVVRREEGTDAEGRWERGYDVETGNKESGSCQT